MVHRAWVELNMENLKHNIQTITTQLPNKTELIAVVKANAYGHGSEEIAKGLQTFGVKTAAVATLEEAIIIRKAGFKGDILIFSYTPIDQAHQLLKWNFIQNVIDYPYAKDLNAMNGPFRVHIKVDTGMNRLGERHSDIEKIQSIIEMKNLVVEGIYSHFSRADSLDNADIEFTNRQIDRFNEMLEHLKALDVQFPKAHLQNSYGLLNYPQLYYDYVRIGTLIYGIRSHHNVTLLNLPLRPVLTIKTKVIIIKHVPAGDTIGYGKNNITNVDRKIAVLPLGFADGIPRQLADYNGEALIRGQRVPIIGSLSLDHMMIDITDVKEVQVNDIVTLVGTDQNETIHIEDIAVKLNTVSHDVLSSLGSRLKRVVLNN